MMLDYRVMVVLILVLRIAVPDTSPGVCKSTVGRVGACRSVVDLIVFGMMAVWWGVLMTIDPLVRMMTLHDERLPGLSFCSTSQCVEV